MATIIPLRRTAAPVPAFELEVTLAGIRPPIWRRLRVAQSLTLRELHHVLQISFGWNDSHLHEFRIGDRRFGISGPGDQHGKPPLDEREARVDFVLDAGGPVQYVYDFGDDWVHQISVKQSILDSKAPKAECLAGARGGPPDDCGGPHGYERLLEVLGDKAHPEHRDLRDWAGPRFNPEKLTLESINRKLRTAGAPSFRRGREKLYEGM